MAAERASRPGRADLAGAPVEADPSRQCPFCPGNEEATPPALETYGPSGTWLVRVVPNLFPAFEGNEPLHGRTSARCSRRRRPAASTRCSCSARSTRQLGRPRRQARRAGHGGAIRDRMEDHARRSTVRYTQAIVNHGREAGALARAPPRPAARHPVRPRRDRRGGGGLPSLRRVRACCARWPRPSSRPGTGWWSRTTVLVVCPFWSGSPYEMLVLPAPTRCTSRTPHRRRRGGGPGDPRRLPLLRSKVGDAAYNLVFHTAPHHHDGPVPLARPPRAAPHEPGRVRAGHRRDDQHRRPGAGRPTPHGVAGGVLFPHRLVRCLLPDRLHRQLAASAHRPRLWVMTAISFWFYGYADTRFVWLLASHRVELGARRRHLPVPHPRR